MIGNMDWIKAELGGLYGQRVIQDINDSIRLYALYEGEGQLWETKQLDYTPTKLRTNLIKYLIKEQARFMMGREPELRTIYAGDAEGDAGSDAAATIEKWLLDTLRGVGWQDKLIKAARDCFIGKRVALKLTGGPGRPLGIQFRTSLEFVYDTDPEDAGVITKAVFFYQVNNETEREKQRVWRQRYRMENGRCLLDEAIFDGNGLRIEERAKDLDTGLDFLPVYVIINDGLTGDLIGESDVREIAEGQEAYNHLKSDDVDALKFNMFPQAVFTDASEESLAQIKVAPHAIIDMQTDPARRDKQAKAEILEPGFSYDQRFENAINRIKNDMYALLSVPNVGLEQLKGLATSGKAMRALYWGLISRCEERWNTWDAALRWMAEGLIKMARVYGAQDLPDIPCRVNIEHLYPIPDDEEEERERDLTEVGQQARSRQSYIAKWQPSGNTDAEFAQIVQEQRMLEDDFAMAVRDELREAGP